MSITKWDFGGSKRAQSLICPSLLGLCILILFFFFYIYFGDLQALLVVFILLVQGMLTSSFLWLWIFVGTFFCFHSLFCDDLGCSDFLLIWAPLLSEIPKLPLIHDGHCFLISRTLVLAFRDPEIIFFPACHFWPCLVSIFYMLIISRK